MVEIRTQKPKTLGKIPTQAHGNGNYLFGELIYCAGFPHP
jgi:hypothetical protein